ncbi:unnamed protein product [Scytosiphon promiscuus]
MNNPVCPHRLSNYLMRAIGRRCSAWYTRPTVAALSRVRCLYGCVPLVSKSRWILVCMSAHAPQSILRGATKRPVIHPRSMSTLRAHEISTGGRPECIDTTLNLLPSCMRNSMVLT